MIAARSRYLALRWLSAALVLVLPVLCSDGFVVITCFICWGSSGRPVLCF